MIDMGIKCIEVGIFRVAFAICAISDLAYSSLANMLSSEPVLRHSDVVFMYAASDEAYRDYGATFVAWGGAVGARQTHPARR